MRRSLRPLLASVEPGLKVLAEGVLGPDSEIDLLASDGEQRVVVVLVGDSGDDLEFLTRGLALAEWCRQRVPDWRQLARDLSISSKAPGRLVLLCPDFHPETLLAAASLEPDRVRLGRIRAVAGEHGSSLLLEPVALRRSPLGPNARAGNAPDASTEDAPVFRSGLREEDLGLTREEKRGLG